MSLYFLDSSALAKRYIAEVGSAWIRDLTNPLARNHLLIARITWVEVLSALARRQREGNMTPGEVAQVTQTFRYDLDMQYRVSELDQALAVAAGELVTRHPVRAYDAVQLAAALRIQAGLAQVTSPALTFLSADDRLLAIARAEGLLTDNPNDHP